jgi:NhaP-type Na+/H+ or K+/H+ antiporter
MKNTIKFITMCLIASSIFIAGMLTPQVDRCRALVLNDMQKHAKFQQQLSQYGDKADFLTAMTRGR